MSAQPAWSGRGKVRARWSGAVLEVAIEGVTTQAKYYKPLVYEFFRKDFRVRPRYGDFSVWIRLEHQGEPPRLDLDNLAKALLDALKGFVFFDDVQIARLLVERVASERERILVHAQLLGAATLEEIEDKKNE
jgi:Holliday junction resolvase RusA-like endonuclease